MNFKQLFPIAWETVRGDFDCVRDDAAASRRLDCAKNNIAASRGLDCAKNNIAASRGLDCAKNNIAASRGLDFHIRLEQDDYVIDVFDSGVSDPGEVYLTTHACEDWQQVVQFCQDYDGIHVF
jgi:hypothetical protein